MVESAQTSQSDFKTYQFVIALNLVHEIGHILISYMQRDGLDKTFSSPFQDGLSRSGEAGMALERMIFGDVLEHVPDVSRGMPQVANPVSCTLLDCFEINRALSGAPNR